MNEKYPCITSEISDETNFGLFEYSESWYNIFQMAHRVSTVSYHKYATFVVLRHPVSLVKHRRKN